MPISAISLTPSVAALSPIKSGASTPVPNREANLNLRSAINKLNEVETAGRGREFAFSIDPKLKIPVVKIVDSDTRQLIDQIPSQSILDLAQQLAEQSLSNR